METEIQPVDLVGCSYYWATAWSSRSGIGAEIDMIQFQLDLSVGPLLCRDTSMVPKYSIYVVSNGTGSNSYALYVPSEPC